MLQLFPSLTFLKVPARRPGHDRDMGNAILFAVTNQYLNGQTVAVDGGYLLHAGSAA
jgi:NAD(P)-dependent dehydrogenase (short-subunit alcohol dehydrogenase family)